MNHQHRQSLCALGAALGGALGTFIPIPVLGTLLGETIGAFVGDLLYYGIMEGNWKKAERSSGQTLKHDSECWW